MTSLWRGDDLGVEWERGPGTIGEDTPVSGTERVRNPSLVESVARRRLADGISCGRWCFFSAVLSCSLVDPCDL
jgi:hypothetical protein